MKGLRDLVIDSNDRSLSANVPFDHFGKKKTRPEVVKLAKMAQNSDFLRLELVWARTFEWKVIETWLYAQMKGLGRCVF